MHVELALMGLRIRSVETDDIELPILHPDSAREPAGARILLRRDVDDIGAHIAEEFAFDEFEIVMGTVESRAVDQQRLRKTARKVLHGEETRERTEGARFDSRHRRSEEHT